MSKVLSSPALPMHECEKSLIAYVKEHLPSLPNVYRWRFDDRHMAAELGGAIFGFSWSDKAYSLKRVASRRWRSSAEADRLRIADLAVRVWGGVKRNYPTTIQRYVSTIAAGKIPGPGYKGIASWTKIATFANPSRFAVFDARVAFSLNAVQALSDTSERLHFPRLPTQNPLLRRVGPALGAMAREEGWRSIEADDVYITYLQVLASVASQAKCRLDEVEMLLFARAELLASEFATKRLYSLP